MPRIKAFIIHDIRALRGPFPQPPLRPTPPRSASPATAQPTKHAATKTKGLHCLHVNKRKTTGWKDNDGRFTDRYYIKCTDTPFRPAWLPVTHEQAEEIQRTPSTRSNTPSTRSNTTVRKIERRPELCS